MLDISQSSPGTHHVFEHDPLSPDWDAAEQGYKFETAIDIDVHIESIGGGGGGGGSGAGGTHGGRGGGAGGYFFEPVHLKAGAYRVKIGQGGVGGWSFGKGSPRPNATSGGASGVSHSISGFDYAPAMGGAAGQFAGAAGYSGETGGGIVHPKTGKVISTGGAGGADDRKGAAGEGPGAGSGGCGHYKGQTDFQSDPGNPGRVTITIV